MTAISTSATRTRITCNRNKGTPRRNAAALATQPGPRPTLKRLRPDDKMAVSDAIHVALRAFHLGRRRQIDAARSYSRLIDVQPSTVRVGERPAAVVSVNERYMRYVRCGAVPVRSQNEKEGD